MSAMARGRGRRPPGSKRAVLERLHQWLPFECPNLHRLSEQELRYLERYLCEVSGREPECHMIGGYSDGQG